MKKQNFNLSKNIDDFKDFVLQFEHFCEVNNMLSISMPMTLVLEELYTNTITHGAKDGRNIDIEIDLNIINKEFICIYKDNGVPFNVLEMAGPDLTSSIENREVGGLGLHYVKVLTDSATYEHLGNNNVIKVTKKLI